MRHAFLTGLVFLIICTPLGHANAQDTDSDSLKVMSRNIYIGANIFRVVEETDPLLILGEIAAVYQTTEDTNYPARAELLADEVALHQPHVLGLQEVSLVRRQSPGDVLNGNPVAATDVESDYLQILLDALSERGMSYTVAASVDNADIELPLFGATLDDIRLTDRDVLLVRSDVAFTNVTTANFSENVLIDLAGTLLSFNRGYNAATVTVGDTAYRVINTHLEVGSQGAIQSAQAAELAQVVADETLPTILLGDFNSSPQSPDGEAYSILTGAGFTDVWTVRSVDDTDPGYTCCHAELLLDPTSVFSSRIDLVLTRFGPELLVDSVDATVTGGDPDARTPEGLWPSDHGGIVANMTVVNNAPDGDGDGIKDNADNCTVVINAPQRDTDADGFGNACDADFNQDRIVNFLDVAYFSQQFGSGDALTDLNGDGAVNFLDLSIVRELFFLAPGPSALAR